MRIFTSGVSTNVHIDLTPRLSNAKGVKLMPFTYSQSIASMRSKHTLKAYATGLKTWAKSYEVESADDVTAKIRKGEVDIYESLRHLVAHCEQKGVSPKSLRLWVTAAKEFCLFEDNKNDNVPLDFTLKYRSKVALP